MSNDFLNRYDLMQRLGNKYTGKNKYRITAFDLIVFFALGIVIGLTLSVLIKEQKPLIKEQKPLIIENKCISCHSTKKKFIDYFTKAGNKHPEQMANAVMATGRPRLLAAVAVAGEKNTPYTVRKGGYKKRHAGAWQVNSKYWGPVPNDPVGQALQAERILEELTESKPIRTALSIYGGDSSSRYANRVLKELQEVPM